MYGSLHWMLRKYKSVENQDCNNLDMKQVTCHLPIQIHKTEHLSASD